MKIALCLVISLSCAAGGMAADFDGDGVADEFTIIRDATKEAEASGIQLVNPFWQKPPCRTRSRGDWASAFGSAARHRLTCFTIPIFSISRSGSSGSKASRP